MTVKVPKGEPGPWAAKARVWREWREEFVQTERLDWFERAQWPHLQVEAFASIQRFYRRSRSVNRVVRLSSAFADFDCGREGGLSAEGAEGVLRRLVARGTVPAPTLLQFSGRGLWAFWLLEEEGRPGECPHAFGSGLELWQLAEEALVDRLARAAPELQVDRNARDAARVTRLHGSLHRATGRRVEWQHFGDAEAPRFYTLPKLLEHLEVSLAGREERPEPARELEGPASEDRPRRKRRDDVDPEASAHGSKGYVTLWKENRLGFLGRVVEEHFRGLIPRGHRHHLLYAHGICWARLGATRAELRARLTRLSRRYCEQPDGDEVTERELDALVSKIESWRASKEGGHVRNRRLAELAGFDPIADRERIESLGLNLDTGPKGRKEQTRAREDAAWSILTRATEYGLDLPSGQMLADELEAMGHETSRRTANRLLAKFRANRNADDPEMTRSAPRPDAGARFLGVSQRGPSQDSDQPH